MTTIIIDITIKPSAKCQTRRVNKVDASLWLKELKLRRDLYLRDVGISRNVGPFPPQWREASQGNGGGGM